MRPLAYRIRVATLACVAVTIGLVVGAAPAHADTSSYLQALSDNGLTVYNQSEAIASGEKICAMLTVANGEVVAEYVFQHSSWGDVPDMTTARTMVVVSVEQLCPWQDHRGQQSASSPQRTDFGPVKM